MSAIFGIVNMNGDNINHGIDKKMIEGFKLYKLDSVKSLYKNNIFFGCGIQYVTPESLYEVLPYYDEKENVIITADAIIDNREELFSLLNFVEEKNVITDSQLILLAYKKFGQEVPKYLVGDFSFVIWDIKKKELFCARDHVGKRTFYYYYANNVFAFCTVMKPLLSVSDNNIEMNERWITDFLALDGIPHETECNETIYKGIYQLPPAHIISLNGEQFKQIQYWNPVEEVQPLKLKTDKEYDDAFKKVFFEAVHCRLRSTDEVGIMLSGGLDSGSVACIAARELSKEAKRLKAFSSIPIKEYKDKLSEYYVADESEYIEAIRDYVNNIDLTYCRSEGKNSTTDIDYFVNILEQPYKIFRNLFWYNEIVEKSSQNGCKVLLNGQFGNSTISYGEFFTHVLTLYRKRKFITLFKEIRCFSDLVKAPYYKVGKEVARTVVPYKLRKAVSSRLNKNYDRFSRVPINPDLVKKWNVEKRFDQKYFNQFTERYYDLNETHRNIVNPIAFSHISAIETKISLAHGIVIRDPTRDKRVIEFCLSLPSEQFVRNGKERYLIRRSMKGILPDKVRLNMYKRGLQSADWIQRIKPQWNNIYAELRHILEDKIIEPYIDISKLKKELVHLEGSLDEKNEDTVKMLLITLIFFRFSKTCNV